MGKKKEISTESVGGIVFFLSLIFLLVLSAINYSSLIFLPAISFQRWVLFLIVWTLGIFLSRYIFRGHLAVFIHELKHSIISNLCGNRSKGMKIRSTHGHFEYEYTKDTAAYNAFIALAPYWVPLFTFLTLGLAMLFLRKEPIISVAIVGIAWGIDCYLNARDISPVQTDFSVIRGGYRVGLLYVAAMNAALFSFLVVWISLDLQGFVALGSHWWQLAVKISQYLTQSR